MNHAANSPRLGLRATLLAVFAAATCASGAAFAAPAVSECMSVEEALETSIWAMSLPAELGVFYGPQQERPEESFWDAPFFGMSCDGPHSCSPQLVAAVERLERARSKQRPTSGPMCRPDEPGCNIGSGQGLPGPGIDLPLPLVPFLADPTPPLHRPAAVVPTAPPEGAQRLHGRALSHRLERPPQARR